MLPRTTLPPPPTSPSTRSTATSALHHGPRTRALSTNSGTTATPPSRAASTTPFFSPTPFPSQNPPHTFPPYSPRRSPKRIRKLVKYGGSYVFVAWQLGLASLIALRGLLEPHSKDMWGCTKGSAGSTSLTTRPCEQVITYLKEKGVPVLAGESGAEALMNKLCWT